MALDTTPVAHCAEFTLATVTCNDDHTRWSVADLRDDIRVVLVRRGRFRRRAGGVTTDIDATVGYLAYQARRNASPTQPAATCAHG
jgi:hypothetical protein